MDLWKTTSSHPLGFFGQQPTRYPAARLASGLVASSSEVGKTWCPKRGRDMPSLHGSHFLEGNPVSHLKKSISLFLGGITFDANVWLIFCRISQENGACLITCIHFWDAVITWWVKSYGNKGWIHHLWDTGNKRCFFQGLWRGVGPFRFFAFFWYHFYFGGSNAYNWLSNKENQPLDLFFKLKKPVVSKWAGLKNKHPLPMEKKTFTQSFFWAPLFGLFRSPRGQQKNPSNSEAQPIRHLPGLGGPASLGQRVDLRSPPRGFFGAFSRCVWRVDDVDGFLGGDF